MTNLGAQLILPLSGAVIINIWSSVSYGVQVQVVTSGICSYALLMSGERSVSKVTYAIAVIQP
jgi:hypothetical protein